jgi:cytochrome oxidase assembly protein ShyY1
VKQLGTIVRTIVSDGRWHRYLTFVILFAVACAGLSYWQFWRAGQTSGANHQIATNWSAPAVPVDRLLPRLSSFAATDQWRPVELHGVYDVAQQLAVRNRSLNGVPGYEVLTPLVLDDGDVFVVDRGFIRTSSQSGAPAAIPAPPTGQVTVTARLLPGESASGVSAPPKGQIESIDLTQVQRDVGKPTYTGAYGWVDTETPSVAVMPTAETQPSLDTGINLSYAIQWISFGLIGFGALGWSVRQDLKDAKDPDTEQDVERTDFVLPRARRRKRPVDPTSDEAIEDSQVEESSVGVSSR